MVALIAQLTLVTGIVIGFLLLVFYVLKQNPRLLQGFQLSALLPSPAHVEAGLVIESRLPLDAKKSLMIIRAGSERYLIGATIDHIDAITRMGDNAAKPNTPNDLTPFATVTPNIHTLTEPLPASPVGLSRFATQPVVTSAAMPQQEGLGQKAFSSQQQGTFQQQLRQVAALQPPLNPQLNNVQADNHTPLKPPGVKPDALKPTIIPQPRRQPRGLNFKG